MCVWVLHQGAWKFNVAVLCGGRWHRCCMGSLCDTKDTRHTFNEVKHMSEGEFAWAAWNLNKREGKNMFKEEKGVWRWSNSEKCLLSIYITDEVIPYLSGNINAYLHLSNKCLCADLWEMLAELVYSGIVRGIVHPKGLKSQLIGQKLWTYNQFCVIKSTTTVDQWMSYDVKSWMFVRNKSIIYLIIVMFISAVWTHSDGIHSLQMINWWKVYVYIYLWTFQLFLSILYKSMGLNTYTIMLFFRWFFLPLLKIFPFLAKHLLK